MSSLSKTATKFAQLLGTSACAVALGVGAADAATTQILGGATAPGGAVIVPPGSVTAREQVWVSDHLQGFCRIANGALSNCIAVGAPGQPAYKTATRQVFAPDLSSKSVGVARMNFNAAGTVTNGRANINPTISAADGAKKTGRLGDVRPDAVALGSDGALYVAANRNGNIFKITFNANGNPSATARVVAQSSDGGGVAGLAFVGNDLYMAEAAGVTMVPNAIACRPANPCVGDPVDLPDVFSPLALTYAAPHLYVGEVTGVEILDVLSGETRFLDGFFNASGLAAKPGTAGDPDAGTPSTTGQLYVGDDRTGGGGNLQGHWYSVDPVEVPAP